MTFQHPTAPRPSDPGPGRRRDRFQHAVNALTGLAVAGSLTATGWIAGQAAHAWSAQQDAGSTTTPVDPASGVPQPAVAERNRPRKPRVVLKDRPTRTRVSTQYVAPQAPVGGGGTVSSGGSGSSQPSHSSPPAPSSGS